MRRNFQLGVGARIAAACGPVCALLMSVHCDGGGQSGGTSDTDASMDGGSVVVNVTITPATDCPLIAGITATPYSVDIGGSASVMASLGDAEAGTADVQWSAPSGSFAEPNAAGTTFLCTVAGSVRLTVTVTLGGCMDSSSVLVECLTPAP